MNNPVAERKRRPWDTPAVKEIQTLKKGPHWDPTFYEKGPLAAAKIGTQNDMWGIFCNSPILMISIFEACWIKSNS